MSARARRFPWSRVRRSEASPPACRRLRRVARRSTRPCQHACSNPRFRSTTAQPSRHFLLLALLMSDCRFALLQDALPTRVNHNFAHRESGNYSGMNPTSLAMPQIDLYVSRRSHNRDKYNTHFYHTIIYTFYRLPRLEAKPIVSSGKKSYSGTKVHCCQRNGLLPTLEGPLAPCSWAYALGRRTRLLPSPPLAENRFSAPSGASGEADVCRFAN